MADLTLSKQDFANEAQNLASQLLKLLESMDDLSATYGVHKFDAGDTNAFVDEDFSTTNTHLTAAIMADVLFALGTVANAATTGVRNSLRECIVGGLP